MKRRLLMGLENEVGFYGARTTKTRPFVNYFLSYLKQIDPNCFISNESGGDEKKSVYWLSNGKKFYSDTGDHPESASAECSSARDIVIQDKADEEIFKGLADICRQETGLEEFAIIKNSVSYKGFNERDGVIDNPISWGLHENYQVELGMLGRAEKFIETWLLPHLVTRIIYTGSGHLIRDKNDSYSYVFSSRAGFTQALCGNSATVNDGKSFIMFRDSEPHADHRRWSRYQIVCAESNMLELPTYLKFLTTHLIWRLLEERWQPNMKRVELESNVAQFQALNNDLYLKSKLKLKSGALKTAIGIQRIYLKAVKTLSDLTDEERHGLELCEWILDLLSHDLKQDGNLEKLFGVLDWTTKWYLIKKEMEKRNWPLSHPKILGMNFRYHSLHPSPKESLWSFLCLKDKEKPFLYRVVSDEEIKQGILQPQQSRARIRSEFIKLIPLMAAMGIKVEDFNWSQAKIFSENLAKAFDIDFGYYDPFNETSESFEILKKYLLKNTPGH